MPLHQNGAKSLSEMPLLHQDVLTEKKVRINPKIPEHLSKSDLEFFFYLISDWTNVRKIKNNCLYKS